MFFHASWFMIGKKSAEPFFGKRIIVYFVGTIEAHGVRLLLGSIIFLLILAYIVQNLHNDKEYIFTTALAQQYFGIEV